MAIASGATTDPKLLANAEELSSEIQTILSHAYSPMVTDNREMRRRDRQEFETESGYRTRSARMETGSAETERRSRRQSQSPDVRGVVTSTPGIDSHTEQGRASANPVEPGSQRSRPVLFPEDTVRDMVHGYLEDVSRQTGRGYVVPPVSPPKFSPGGDWNCFLSEFRDMVRLAGLQPSHQLAYFKQAVPEEAKRMLYQHKVTNLEQAIQMLSELYEPVKDTWTVLQELEKVSQKPGERFRVLAGRIEGIARKYSETLQATSTVDLNRLVASRFRHAITDEETRNHLLWDSTDMSLDEMVLKAQKFEDARKSSQSLKKNLRAQGEGTESERLKKEVAELRKQIEELTKEKTSSKKVNLPCWNCGKKGHFARECRHKKIGDGFTFRPKRKDFGQKSQNKQTSTKTTEALN